MMIGELITYVPIHRLAFHQFISLQNMELMGNAGERCLKNAREFAYRKSFFVFAQGENNFEASWTAQRPENLICFFNALIFE